MLKNRRAALVRLAGRRVVIDGLKPYPAMKDSGVPWLGEVPAHWEVRRGRRLFKPRSENDRRSKQWCSR